MEGLAVAGFLIYIYGGLILSYLARLFLNITDKAKPAEYTSMCSFAIGFLLIATMKTPYQKFISDIQVFLMAGIPLMMEFWNALQRKKKFEIIDTIGNSDYLSIRASVCIFSLRVLVPSELKQ